MTENAFERFINSEEGEFIDHFREIGELHGLVEAVFELAEPNEDPLHVQKLKKKAPTATEVWALCSEIKGIILEGSRLVGGLRPRDLVEQAEGLEDGNLEKDLLLRRATAKYLVWDAKMDILDGPKAQDLLGRILNWQIASIEEIQRELVRQIQTFAPQS